MSNERKSCNSSGWGIICQGFRGFLNSEAFPIQFVLLSFQNKFFIKIFDTENWIFHRKPVIMVYRFHPFLKKIEFSWRERKCRYFFSIGMISTRTATHLSTIFVKENIMKNLKFNVEMQLIMHWQIYQTVSINNKPYTQLKIIKIKVMAVYNCL